MDSQCLERRDFRGRMIVVGRPLELRFRSHWVPSNTREHRRAWTYLQRLASAPNDGASGVRLRRLTLELRKNGRNVPVRPQPLKVLALLLQRPGVTVSRDDLQRALWGGETFVDFEQGVNHAVRELRAALGDIAESPRFIQTLPRRGYRFIAPVEAIPALETQVMTAAAPLPETPAITHTLPFVFLQRRIALYGAAAVVLCVAGIYMGLRIGEGRNLYPAPALVVRPFLAPADPALGVGLANAISARLGGQQTFSVRSDSNDPWPSGATLALDGEIAVNGPQVEVIARLRDSSGTSVWSDRIGVRSDELFQSKTSSRIASSRHCTCGSRRPSRSGFAGGTRAMLPHTRSTFAAGRP
jgi:DNA-binding winged helix-turn-helix (wHTH) protein